MKKKDLIEILRKLLKTDIELNFLNQLKAEQLEKLVACVRERVEHG